MRRLAKNLILVTATVSAIFFVDLSDAAAASFEQTCCTKKFCPLDTDNSKKFLDFWSKFRDTVMPDEPQDNNPPKEMEKPKPVDPPKEAAKPREVEPPREVRY